MQAGETHHCTAGRLAAVLAQRLADHRLAAAKCCWGGTRPCTEVGVLHQVQLLRAADWPSQCWYTADCLAITSLLHLVGACARSGNAGTRIQHQRAAANAAVQLLCSA